MNHSLLSATQGVNLAGKGTIPYNREIQVSSQDTNIFYCDKKTSFDHSISIIKINFSNISNSCIGMICMHVSFYPLVLILN